MFWERSKKSRTKFSRPFRNRTKCMWVETTYPQLTFDTKLKFLFLAVAEKSFGKVGQNDIFFTFPGRFFLTKLLITFDRLNRFSRNIACFKEEYISFKSMFLDFQNSTLLKIFEVWSPFKLKSEISRKSSSGFP